MAGGRPSIYSQDTAEIICELVRLGKTLKEIEVVKGLPSEPTIMRWASTIPEFQEQYARAREDSGDVWADEGAIITRKVMNGEIDPAAARVALDGIKWISGTRKPKVYGNKQAVEMSGSLTVIEGSLEEVLAVEDGATKKV